ncbi:tetratricopeptide repeat-containing sensor histidine kinase [Psychroserpens burtonensis]|nr:ATP-binding protein [Psychroserpens burtonensis]
MKKISFILLFCLTTFYSRAQIKNSDSLKLVMESYKKKDTIQVQNIFKYAYGFIDKEPAKANQYFSKAMQLAKEINYKEGIIDILLGQAAIEGRLEKYDAEVANILQALEVAEINRLTKTYYYLHYQLSEGYRMMGDNERTRYHAEKALSIAESERNDEKIAKTGLLLGSSYMINGQWDKAEPLFDSAKKIAIKLNDKDLETRVNSRMAYQFITKKDYVAAIVIYREDLLYYKKIDFKPMIAYDYVLMSNAFTQLNKKDSAYHYANKALKTAEDNNLIKELRDAYRALFKSRKKFGQYKEALQYRMIYDSLNQNARTAASGKIAEKARMEIEQSQKDLATKTELLQREKKIAEERNLMYSIIVVISLILIFLFWNNRQKQKAKRKIEEAFAKLKETQAQLIQSEKMASLGELTAGIAHEIQNPLNFVNNFSEVNKELLTEMKEELEKGNLEDVKAIADDVISNEEKINHHGKRADAIVKGMLQHSRASSAEKEPTDINKLADEYLRLAYHGLRAKDKAFNAELVTDFDESISKIDVIPQDIGRVILNLITNAFYATNERKKTSEDSAFKPTVSIATKMMDNHLGTGGERKGNAVQISVKDNGNGIPKDIVDKIFQPFFTTKPTGSGTGLGLSLSYDIIKTHGGEIAVESTASKGTTFTIILPINQEI